MKSLFEQMGGTYREENGYLIPNLTLPEEERVEIGVWGMRHLEYIKNHHKGFYTALILDCKVNRYLVDINNQAEEMFDTLIKQFKQAEGITEQLKADEKQFKNELLTRKKAHFDLTYASGKKVTSPWNASSFDFSSNLRGNIQSRPFWRNKAKEGLIKVEVFID